MLSSNVAIVWPELANVGPSMLEYVALKCCDRLAGALRRVGLLICLLRQNTKKNNFN